MLSGAISSKVGNQIKIYKLTSRFTVFGLQSNGEWQSQVKIYSSVSLDTSLVALLSSDNKFILTLYL